MRRTGVRHNYCYSFETLRTQIRANLLLFSCNVQKTTSGSALDGKYRLGGKWSDETAWRSSVEVKVRQGSSQSEYEVVGPKGTVLTKFRVELEGEKVTITQRYRATKYDEFYLSERSPATRKSDGQIIIELLDVNDNPTTAQATLIPLKEQRINYGQNYNYQYVQDGHMIMYFFVSPTACSISYRCGGRRACRQHHTEHPEPNDFW